MLSVDITMEVTNFMEQSCSWEASSTLKGSIKNRYNGAMFLPKN
jgi:hypothetical protein